MRQNMLTTKEDEIKYNKMYGNAILISEGPMIESLWEQ